MKNRKTRKFIPTLLMVAMSLVFVACGRDVSTVESAVEGHWTVTDARMNGEPLEEVIQEYDEFLNFDSDTVTGAEGEATEIALDVYFNEGVLTLVNAEGEETRLPYEVTSSDEDNGRLDLAFDIEEEDVNLSLNQAITFTDEERESISSTINIVDVELLDNTPDEEMTEVEEAFYQMGQDIVMRLFEEIELEFDLSYVDDSQAPAGQ